MLKSHAHNSIKSNLDQPSIGTRLYAWKDSPPVQDKSPIWIVVVNGGMENEKEVGFFYLYKEAIKCVRFIGYGDIMRRLNDGTLTTEY